jgi:L-asparaginase II
MDGTPLAITYRGGRIDALHHGSIAVADASGALIFQRNDPHYPAYLRSSSKMIQALPVILSGAADRFGLTEKELAVCCAITSKRSTVSSPGSVSPSRTSAAARTRRAMRPRSSG